MECSRLNKRKALWSDNKSSRACKTWFYIVKTYFSTNDLDAYCSFENPIARSFAQLVENKTFEVFTRKWFTRINREVGPSGRGQNKLRLYKASRPISQPNNIAI